MSNEYKQMVEEAPLHIGYEDAVVNDAVNHPKHYTSSEAKCSCGKTIECIQIVENMEFNLGNAMKYIWRCDLKKDAIEDMKKAIWYLQREVARRSSKL